MSIETCVLCDQWISVKDQLPIKHQLVLVWAKGVPNDYFEISIYCNDRFGVDDVTHWRPLPAPPVD